MASSSSPFQNLPFNLHIFHWDHSSNIFNIYIEIYIYIYPIYIGYWLSAHNRNFSQLENAPVQLGDIYRHVIQQKHKVITLFVLEKWSQEPLFISEPMFQYSLKNVDFLLERLKDIRRFEEILPLTTSMLPPCYLIKFDLFFSFKLWK